MVRDRCKYMLEEELDEGDETYISGICDDSRGSSCIQTSTKPSRMGILLITESLSAEFVVECVLRWKAGLDEAVP